MIKKLMTRAVSVQQREDRVFVQCFSILSCDHLKENDGPCLEVIYTNGTLLSPTPLYCFTYSGFLGYWYFNKYKHI